MWSETTAELEMRGLANAFANGTRETDRDMWSGWNVWDEPQGLFAGSAGTPDTAES